MLRVNHLVGFGFGGQWLVAAEGSADSNDVNNAGVTLVNSISAAAMLYSGSKFRLTLTPPSTGNNSNIGAMYAGHVGAGDLYDFDGTQVQVTVAGSGTITLTAGGAVVVTDEITYAIDETKAFVVAFQFPSTPASDIRYKASPLSGWTAYYKSSVQEAATTDKTTYSTSSGSNTVVTKIEVFQ